MKNKISPHHVDIHVGHRVKTRRVLRGMSQSKLAKKIGLTFQQLQKYESGVNRISASRLWQIAQVLDVPIAWFFEGLNDESTDIDISTTEDTVEVVHVVQTFPDDLRKAVHHAVRAVADTTVR